ncbi:response regulator transcription factor [Anaerobacillus sp. MEB173]|uniref:response regulator transcription factor n=1 Tax=Anaerobacillus sp. MEB173 TaxID=3383345 RepID=UPI003F93E5E5
MDKAILTPEDYEKIVAFYDFGIQKKAQPNPHEIQQTLAELFGFSKTILWSIDKKGQIHSPILYNLSEKITSEYINYYRSLDILHPQRLTLSPSVSVLRIHEVMVQKAYEETEYYQDFMKKHGFYDEMGVYLFDGTNMKAVLGLIRTKEEPPFSEKEMQLLSRILKPLSAFLGDQTSLQNNNELTKREQEIIELVKEGLTNKEIASSLHVSENTIKKHLQHIYRKMNVSNRTSLCYVLAN